MQVTMEQLDPCKVLLNIEVDADEVERAIDRVYRDFNQSINVPGFRKGKVPRPILERYVRPDSVYRHAIDYLVPPAYAKALQESGVEPYDEPQLELVSLERNKPFAFKATVPLPPKVELGEYKGIPVKRRAIPITEEDVENEVKRLQERHSTFEPVEGRAVEMDDVVVAEIAHEGEDEAAPRVSMVQIGQNAPEFDQALLGTGPGDERSVTIPAPAEEGEEQPPQRLRVKVREIKKRILPEVHDEFAKNVGGAETLEALKAGIRREMERQVEQLTRAEMESKLVEELLNRSTLYFPDSLVERDVAEDMRQLQGELDKRGLTQAQYLEGTNKTEEHLSQEMAERSRGRIRAGLVLGEIARKENIALSDEDVDAYIEKLAEENKMPAATFRQYLEAQQEMESIRNRLLRDKIMAFLTEQARIEQEEQSGE
ncbi:MAG: trigger factor [Armatimonadetes bacterium]|nr:trigger factor [Armatimonadota bacterium]